MRRNGLFNDKTWVHCNWNLASREYVVLDVGQSGDQLGLELSVADIMSKEKRSALMSRIRGKNTKPERVIARGLRASGKWPIRHERRLPGRPDFVFWKARVVVFVDGDFWHGWRFPTWKAKLQPFWREKIETNRQRDQRNFRKLRRDGWKVIRIWEHEIKRDPDQCVTRIVEAIDSRYPRREE
jgi:DNA mismatch endonuclease (patch repair protein)